MLAGREHSYRTIFENAALSLWEEDFSWCKAAIDKLKHDGITEFRQYFKTHPEFVADALRQVRILDVNQRSVKLFGAKDKEELMISLNRIFVPETMPVFVEELVAIAEGNSFLESEAVVQSLQGRRLTVHFTISFPEATSAYDHVVVALTDVSEKQHAENALRASEERFRALADNAPVMVWMSGSDKLCTWFNRNWLDFVGRPMANELGNGWAENVHPDDLKNCVSTYTMHFDKREPFSMEYRLRRWDDTWRWVLDNGTPNYTANGEFIGYMGSCIDITESKQAVANYLEIFEKANDAIYVHDLETLRIIEVNQRAIELSGYSKDEIANGNPFELMVGGPDDSIATVRRYFEQAAKSGRQTFELHARHKNGHFFWVETTLYRTAIAGTDRIIAFFHDIDARKQAEQKIQKLNDELEKKVVERTLELEKRVEELRENHEKFQKAFHGSAAGITIARVNDGAYIDVNEAFTAITEYSKEELINHNSLELGIIINPAEREEFLRRIRENGSVREFEMLFRSKSGKIRIALASTETILLQNEKFAISIFYDITERKNAEVQLREANAELESFSHSISHDLRGPLRSMIGFAQLLEEDFGEIVGKDGKTAMLAIQQIGLGMYGLIDGLLALSMSGKKELEKSVVDTESLVRHIVKEIRSENNYKAEVITKVLLPAYGDPVLLTQVWTNLVANALKYSSNAIGPVVEIGSSQEASEIVYYVKDNGAGFDMQYAGKLFSVFQRLHKEEEFKGSGIGLSIVKRIVTRHEGRVWAEGKVNEGATFYFSLPAK
jgi:PAS domain S-box-containing protein